MKKVIVAAIVVCGFAASAHADCSNNIKYVPATRADVAAIVETGKQGHRVFVNYELLDGLAQQTFEDVCLDSGIVLPDVAPEVAGGCDVPGLVVKLKRLRKLLQLSVLQTRFFCAVGRSVVDEAPVGPDASGEFVAEMCLPIGPEGAMQTATVHIDEVFYWEQNGGTSGSCGGQSPPPQH